MISERATQVGKGPKKLLVRCRHDETARIEDGGLVPRGIVSRFEYDGGKFDGGK
jgi:hypothetical protein